MLEEEEVPVSLEKTEVERYRKHIVTTLLKEGGLLFRVLERF